MNTNFQNEIKHRIKPNPKSKTPPAMTDIHTYKAKIDKFVLDTNEKYHSEMRESIRKLLTYNIIGIKAKRQINFQADLKVEKTLEEALVEFMSLSKDTEKDEFISDIQYMKIEYDAQVNYETPLTSE